MGLPHSSVLKNLPAHAADVGLIPGQRDPWIRKWQPTAVFFPGKSHGQSSPVSYSPWDHKRVRQDLAAETMTTSHTLLLYTFLHPPCP